jgi:hypothetical protein
LILLLPLRFLLHCHFARRRHFASPCYHAASHRYHCQLLPPLVFASSRLLPPPVCTVTDYCRHSLPATAAVAATSYVLLLPFATAPNPLLFRHDTAGSLHARASLLLHRLNCPTGVVPPTLSHCLHRLGAVFAAFLTAFAAYAALCSALRLLSSSCCTSCLLRCLFAALPLSAACAAAVALHLRLLCCLLLSLLPCITQCSHLLLSALPSGYSCSPTTLPLLLLSSAPRCRPSCTTDYSLLLPPQRCYYCRSTALAILPPLYCRSLPHATAATCYRPLLPLLSALYCRHPPAAPAALVLRLLLWSLPASISSSLRHPMLPPAAVCMLLRSLLRSLFCCTLRRLLCCLR